MALHKKFEQLCTLNADILIVQECPHTFARQVNRWAGWSAVWYGRNPHKGLALLARAPWAIREAHSLKPEWTAKVVLDGPACIEVFPIWACVTRSPAAEYIEQVHLLLDFMERSSLSPSTIVAGDFNSNSAWDSDYGSLNHSSAVERFRRLEMESAYHVFSHESQGAERCPTLWFRKASSAAYHIDYAFLGRPLLAKLTGVMVGRREEWISWSDHAPLLVELDL